MVSIAILAVVIALAAALFHPAVANNRTWRAIVTPLASIIGSGFLVIGPLLDYNYGYLAPIVMAGLCLTAFLFGCAIRRNNAELGSGGWQPGSAQAHIETASSWVLAFAYVISVAYYLNLFGAFAVSMTGVDSPYYARLVTTAMLVFLLLVGSMRGFSALEGLEQVTVSIKLAIIGGLLLGDSLVLRAKSSNARTGHQSTLQHRLEWGHTCTRADRYRAGFRDFPVSRRGI